VSTALAGEPQLHIAEFSALTGRTLYELIRLRVDVFVVEQRCPYPELDGRDLEPGTRHLWLSRAGSPVAYLRLLSEADGNRRIGRVLVARHARGAGYANRLMGAALELIGTAGCVLDAQSHLAGFYARYGFVVTGGEFVEDGIPHLPMHRPGG
jgi:ElaA protein